MERGMTTDTENVSPIPDGENFLEKLVTALETANSNIEAAGKIAEYRIVHEGLMDMLKKTFTDGFEHGLKIGYTKGYMEGKHMGKPQ